MSEIAWRWFGDAGLLCTVMEDDIVAANAAVRALRHRVVALDDGAALDAVPGARSLLVLLRPGADPSPALVRALEAPVTPDAAGTGATHAIEVVYGGGDGPDLEQLAREAGMSAGEVVTAHTGATYTVAFLGFAPGFPYLLGLDPRLAAPRLPTPRTRVPAGSVAIGGPWTGVYSRTTPGGWRLIGRTDAEMFDPARPAPALLAPGDLVRFVAR